MKLADNQNIQSEALKRIGLRPDMDASRLTTANFDRLLLEMDALKASAGPYRNVVVCVDCLKVHSCPFDAEFENAFTHRRVCGHCGSRSGFRDVVGRWISFAKPWSFWMWGSGCWAFEFCTEAKS
jgi:hypothetical protein